MRFAQVIPESIGAQNKKHNDSVLLFFCFVLFLVDSLKQSIGSSYDPMFWLPRNQSNQAYIVVADIL